MENESRENEARLASLVEAADRQINAYEEVIKTNRTYPEELKKLRENLMMIVEKIEEIDSEAVPEKAKDILKKEREKEVDKKE